MLINFSKAPYGSVIAAGLIDAALTIGFFVFLFSVLPVHILDSIKSAMNVNLVVLTGYIIYRLVMISLFDSTAGMKVFYIQFLNGEQQPLGIKEKLLASIFVLYQGVDYYKKEVVKN